MGCPLLALPLSVFNILTYKWKEFHFKSVITYFQIKIDELEFKKIL